MRNLFDKYWQKWTTACAVGELLGMGAVALIALSYNRWAGEPLTAGSKALNLLVMVFAGAIEGFVLGFWQWRVLRLKFPIIPAKEWIGYTMAVAMLGWFLGMLPSLLLTLGNAPVPPEEVEPPLVLILAGAMALGLFLGAMFGLFQWFAFHKYARESIQWVTGNSLGWGLGMMFIFAAAAWPDAASPLFTVILAGMAGGSLAGLSVGAITGIYLNRIIAENEAAGGAQKG
ncbi:MAG: hypothetical protein EPO28_10930 [Saprospiraceae bacterium]|nr:MAG: hypothetical protein EPO28_10930 [Saprospiraceae bacterium]